VDEARRIISRLDRIEALKSSEAPADELLAEVRELLAEGEAWIAAERDEGGQPGGREAFASGGGPATDGAAAALAGCRRTLTGGKEVRPETAETAPL
jgi:hypothetical protein